MRLGEAQRDLFSKYEQGVSITISLTAEEKVYWAAGAQHNPSADKATKHLVHGDIRREHQANLMNFERTLIEWPKLDFNSSLG